MGSDRNRWLAEHLPCPCVKCKKAITRLRRICLVHVEDWGLWEDLRKHARQESSDPCVWASFDISPHWSVIGGSAEVKTAERLRQESGVGTIGVSQEAGTSQEYHVVYPPEHHVPSPPHVEMEDTIMHEMVEDLLLRKAQQDDVCDDDCACEAAAQRDEKGLLDAARKPLYAGSTYSVLRASLELLILQAMFGWSSASVDTLLR